MSRIDKLRWLIDSKFAGSQAEFARAIGKAPSQVGQWTGGHRRLGDGGARNIELKLNLAPGWFDTTGGELGVAESPAAYAAKITPLSAAPVWERELLDLARGLSDEGRRELITMARFLMQQKPRTKQKASS